MIKVIASATVNIVTAKRNPRNNKYMGTYKIQHRKPLEFTMLYNRKNKTATFIPALIYPNHKEYLVDTILKQVGI